jgi:hypothetical protein
MIAFCSEEDMIASHFTIDHIRLVTDKDFTDVTRSFEERLGRFDSTVFQSAPSDPEQTRSRISVVPGWANKAFVIFMWATPRWLHQAIFSRIMNA